MTAPALARSLAFARTIATAWILLPLLALSLPLWSWPITSYATLYLVIGGFTGCFWIGCMAASLVFAATDAPAPAQPKPHDATLLRAIMIGAIGLNLLTIATRAAFNPFACADLLACSNDAYQAYIEGQTTGSGAAFEYVRIGLSPFIYGALALAIWGSEAGTPGIGRLRWGVIASEVVLAVATGTSRNIGNVLLFALFAASIRRLASGVKAKPRSPWVYVGAVVLVALFLAYFSFTQLNRDGAVAAVGLLPFGHGYVEALSYTTDDDSVLLKGAESIVRYLASGYFCLALAIDLPTGLTFPFGSSMFLARRAIDSTGDGNYVTLSLPGQMESLYGWSYMQQWQSLFSWLLSDYGYIGTGIVMIGVGFYFIAACGIALTDHKIFSKLPVFLGFIMVIYIPANNQIFQTPETYICFVFSAMLLLFLMLQRQRRASLS